MALAKVFRIELNGGKDVEKDIQSIRKAMKEMATAIRQTKAELAALLSSNADPAAVVNLTNKIAELEARLKSLSQQRKTAETDAKRQAEAEKLLADAKLKEAQAAKAQAQADEARMKSQIAQEKELDRQIDRERKEQQELEKKKRILDALPGSYNAIRNSLNELRPLIQSGNTGTLINFGGQQISFDQAIEEYKKLSAAEQSFRRQFTRDGTLVGEYASGIVDAFKKLNIDDIIKNQVDGAKDQLTQLEKKTNDLVVAYRAAQQQGGADLNALEKEIHDNVVETEELRKKVIEAEVQLRGIGGVGEQITGSIKNGFKELKQTIGQFVLGYVGFQAVFSGLQTGAQNAKEFADQTTELEIQLNKAKGGADGLIGELGKLNTRTKLNVLEDIANIASKAGTTEQNLLGVSRGIDVVKTAFGKDFGDIETGTETFVKLINIFFDDGQVTEDRILKIGNSLRTLANETVASVPYINDFAGRMAGVRQVANVTLPQIIGLGAGFEEFKQSAEVSSTVLVKVIPQLARDIETFANIAGVSREEFKKLLQDNPIEALLKVSEGLVAGKGDVEVFANALKDAGVDAGRTTSIIATLGGKADIFRDRIARAGQAIQSTDAITDAFNRKNENMAATLDKIQKKFADVAAGKAFQTTLLAIATAVTFLLNSIPALIALGTLLAFGWAVQNKELFILRARLLLVNAQLVAGQIALGVLTIAQTGYNAILFVTNGALALVTRGLAFFGITVKATAGPLGIILTVVGLLAAGFAAFGRRIEAVRSNLSEYVRLQQINNEINREALKSTSDQIAALDGWMAVVKSAATSADTKRKAMEKLIEINPAFRNALQGETIDLKELEKAYGQVVLGIQAKARAEAAATLSAGKQKKVTEISALRQELEIQISQDRRGQSVTEVELTDEQKKILKQSTLFSTGAIVTFTDKGAQIFRQRFDQVKKFLDKKEQEAIAIYQDYLKAQALAEEQLTKAEQQVINTDVTPTETVFQIFDRLIANNGTGSDFKELLKKIQEQKKATSVLSKEYQDLLALEKKVRELIKPKGGREGNRRSPEKEKLDNALKLIEASINDQKAALEARFSDGLISERDYYSQLRDITINGEQRKIDTILEYQQRYKKALARFNGELTKEISVAERNQVKAKREANQKLFEIDNKQLEVNLRNQQLLQEQQLRVTELNPDLSNEQRIQEKQDYYDRLLLAQITFNQQQVALEKKYGIVSIENEQKRKEAIEKIRQEITDLEKQSPEARQKDIQAAADRQLAEIRRRIAERTTAILETNDSYTKKARALAKLESQATKERLAAEAAAAKIALEQAKKDRDAKLISEKEYLDKLEDYKTKEAALYKVTTNEQISATRRFILALKELKDQFSVTILGIKEYSDDAEGEQERIKDALKQTADTVKQTISDAFNAYFTNQAQRIDADLKEQEDYLDREKKRVLARASSESEKETIERQYDQKRKLLEKKAAEEKRSLALKQASIEFAVAVLKTFAQFGFPLGLIPVAALTAAYFFQRAQIQKQQFEMGGNLLKKKQYGFGGKAGEVPVQGGVFGGKPHSQGGTDFEFGGKQYNAQAKELSIIRTENAPKDKVFSITGNHTQIASALNTLGGGVSFQPGATVRKFDTGGQLGTRLRPPTFNSGYYLSGVNSASQSGNDLNELKQMVADVTAAVYATDRKPVVQDTRTVTKSQSRIKKDVSLGTI
jgi:hypothetical protein